MLTQPEKRLATCPEKSALKNYLLGKLSDEILDQFEDHFSDCADCEETLRGLDANDTFSKLVNSAVDLPEALDDQDKQFVGSLITQMKSEDRFHRLDGELAEKAAEVTRLLMPVEDEPDCMGTFGDYRIESLIGVGSTGVVFRAVDRKLNRLVALKILRPSLGRAARERFMAEARLAAAIEHQNVVTIYQVGEEEVGGLHPIAFIAMQWVAGETLEDRFKKVAFLPEDEVKEIASQIALGLSAAHQKDLIHRDIKPANIWLCEESNRVIILDFGLARIADDDPHMTNTGMLAGTPNFMSPEQTRGQELDGRSDLFSLGCLMYRTATGKLPFGSNGVLATLQSIQTHSPSPPATLNPHISDDFSDLVMCLLEKQAANRPENAVQLIDAMKLPRTKWSFVAANHQTFSPKTKNLPQKRSGITAWISLAILFGLIASFGYMFAPDIIRIATNQGELVIDCKDKDIKIEVLSGGEVIKVIDTRTEQTINIKAGDYSFQVQDARNGFTVSPSKLTMTRGGKEVVTISSGESKYKNSEIAALTAKLDRSLSQSMKEGSPELIKKLKKEVAEAEKILDNDSPRLNVSESSMNDLKKIDELKRVLHRIRNDQYSPLNTRLTETKKEGNRIFRESENTDAKRHSPRIVSPNDATYGGKTFAEWASILKTERDGETINRGLKAIAQLSRDDDKLQKLAIDAVRPIVRKHGGLELGDFGHVDAITEFFNFIPSNLVLDFVVDEIKSGTPQSQRQLFWLLSPNNMVEYVSTAPELATARQNLHLRNLKSRFPEISKACVDASKTADSERKKTLELVQQWATSFSNSTLEQLKTPFRLTGDNDSRDAQTVEATTKNTPTYDGKTFNEWIAILSTERNYKTVNSAIKALGELSRDEPEMQTTAMDAIRPLVRRHGSIVVDDQNRVESINRFFSLLNPNVIIDFAIEEIKSGTPQSQAHLFWLLSPEIMVGYAQLNDVAMMETRKATHRNKLNSRLLEFSKVCITVMESVDSENQLHVASVLQRAIECSNKPTKRRGGMSGGMFNQVKPLPDEPKLDPAIIKYLSEKMQSTKDAETSTYIAIELIRNGVVDKVAIERIKQSFFDENMPEWIPVIIYHKVLLHESNRHFIQTILKLFYQDSLVDQLVKGAGDPRLRSALILSGEWSSQPTPDSIRIRLIQKLGGLGKQASEAKEWLTEQSTLQVPWASEAKKALSQIEADSEAKKNAKTPSPKKHQTIRPNLALGLFMSNFQKHSR